MIECGDNVCKCCGKPAQIWSRKKDQEKEFWCSHTCILKFRGEFDN